MVHSSHQLIRATKCAHYANILPRSHGRILFSKPERSETRFPTVHPNGQHSPRLGPARTLLIYSYLQ
jgi:hypothetical protein